MQQYRSSMLAREASKIRRKLFPVTILAVAVLIALGRCAPTVETPPRPPTPVPTPAGVEPSHFVEKASAQSRYYS